MKIKRVFTVSLAVMFVALAGMAVNWWIIPFADWAVRGIGIMVLADLAVLSYSAVKLKSASNRDK